MAKKFYNGIDVQSQKIVSLADPTAANDAATKSYVDGLVNGISWKNEVRAASTANGALATAYENGDIIDGVTLATNDRILLKAQTTQTENGIYTVNASGAPTRSTDADSTAELNNATVLITEGTVNAGRSYTQTTVNPTVGSSNLVWSQYNVGNVYTASTGLTLSTLDFQLASSSAGAGLTFSSGVLDVVGDASITVGANSLGLATGVAGAGLTLTTGVLDVVAGDTSVTVSANSLAVNPAASGGLTVSSGLKVDSTVARVFSIGTHAATTSIAITHSLGKQFVQTSVYITSTGEQIECDVVATSTTVTTFTFAVAPTTNTLTFVIVG